MLALHNDHVRLRNDHGLECLETLSTAMAWLRYLDSEAPVKRGERIRVARGIIRAGAKRIRAGQGCVVDAVRDDGSMRLSGG